MNLLGTKNIFYTTRSSELLKTFFLGILLIIFTFPENDWTYCTGIDAPLSWVFNHLFEHGLKTGKYIIFPHGPLAFFMYPLTENILLSTLVNSLLKFLLFINLLFLLSKQRKNLKWILSFSVAYYISLIAEFNHLILANLILIYCNIFAYEKRQWRYIAYFLTAFAFFVKAYVAFLSGILFISYTGYYFFTSRNLKKTIIDCLTLMGLIILFWIAMYGSPSGLINYTHGMLHLAMDNSSAVSYYPQIDWPVLSLFLLTFPLLLFLNRSKKFLFYLLLTGLSLFAAWKHGMARLDVFHANNFYSYLMIFYIILLIYSERNTCLNLSIIVLGTILFTQTLKNSIGYKTPLLNFFSADNFVEFVTKFDELKLKSEKKSQEKIAINKLPKNITDSIGNQTVDIYPWDYSVIAANNFNWVPRVVINSYASYTSWLDNQNASHFSSQKSPEFLIIEKIEMENFNGGQFSSLDYRYLLNDEPKTIIEILKNYKKWHSNERFIIARKKKQSSPVTSKISASNEATWSEWMKVPELKDGQLLRAKLNYNKSIRNRIKSFLFKDEQFFIYIKLDDNSIHKYRIVTENASDGLWINPYVFASNKILSAKEIMFKASNEDFLSKKLSIKWEIFDFNHPNTITNFFASHDISKDTLVFQSSPFGKYNKEKYWIQSGNDLISKDEFEGEKSYLVKPGGFSYNYFNSLDDFRTEDIRIEADCWVKEFIYRKSNNIQLVISIEDNDRTIIRKEIPIDEQIIDCSKWNHILNYINVKNLPPCCNLSIYLWNNGSDEILMNNLRVKIIKIKNLSPNHTIPNSL